MLNDHKCSSQKSSLGFDKFTASYSHDASTSRTVFVKPEISEPLVACLDKGKNVIVHEHVQVEFEIPVKKQSKSKFIPTCFHCGIIGHTRPYCLQICSQNLGLRSLNLRKGKAGRKHFLPKYAQRQRTQPSQKSIPTCHHCSKIGHTQSSCFKLKSCEHDEGCFD